MKSVSIVVNDDQDFGVDDIRSFAFPSAEGGIGSNRSSVAFV